MKIEFVHIFVLLSFLLIVEIVLPGNKPCGHCAHCQKVQANAQPKNQENQAELQQIIHPQEKPVQVAQEAKPQVQHEIHDNDKEIQLMAISTLANMASAIVNIGSEPHNSVSVGANVIKILGGFVNFVSYAMRHPELLELIEQPEFQDALNRAIELDYELDHTSVETT